MKQDTHKTEVIFYREIGSDGIVFAFFPKEKFDFRGNFASYAHIGQHSACSLDYVKDRAMCEPCESESEFADLKRELESLGYNLKVKNCLLSPTVLKTTLLINNSHRVYQVVTSTGKQVFCNIEQLNEVVEWLGAHEGYFKIYHFWNNKAEKVSKKNLKSFFDGAQLVQSFTY